MTSLFLFTTVYNQNQSKNFFAAFRVLMVEKF